jgi:hypothetical protein
MYWYQPRQRKFAQQIEQLVALLIGGTVREQANAARSTTALPYNEKLNEALVTALKNMFSSGYTGSARQLAMMGLLDAVTKHIEFMPSERKKELLDLLIDSITTGQSPSAVSFSIVGMLPKFGEMARDSAQSLRSYLGTGSPQDEDEKRLAAELAKSIELMESVPDTDDTHIVGRDPKENAATWKKIQKQIGKNTKVKVRPIGQGAGAIALGTIAEITYVPYKVGTETFNVPVILIVLRNDERISVNVLSPKFDVWTYRDVQDIPLSEYKGIWVVTDDAAATNFVGAKPGTFVQGILLSKEKETATIKIIKDGIPWTIEVPSSSVKPSKEAAQWGIEYSRRKSPVSIGEVVEIKSDPGTKYVVESFSEGKASLRPVSRPAAGVIMADYADLKYVGRFDLAKGVVGEPHMRSPLIKKPKLPDAE